jgi:hypothetical protein
MTPYLFWDRDKRAEFHSLHELEQLIEQLTIQATKDNMPLGIEVNVNIQTCLLITVGCEKSHLAFHTTTGPYAVVCRGPWDSDERIEASFMGEPSSVEKRYCVPIADAQEALRRYFQTGARPDNIMWEV